MTNEEALKRMKWTKGRTGITSEEAEAIGYAIEKLSNSDEDCISRAELLKHQRSLYDEYLMDWVDVVEVKTIENMQSIQTKAKVGHWIEEETDIGQKVYCSNCGKSAVFEYYHVGDVYSGSGHGRIKKTKFCPNCGSKMEEDNAI